MVTIIDKLKKSVGSNTHTLQSTSASAKHAIHFDGVLLLAGPFLSSSARPFVPVIALHSEAEY
jgi:hypothetical protein